MALLRLMTMISAGALSTTVLAQAPQLPGGATSLNETYQDWTVGCRVVNDTRSCTITQQQQRQDGQRVLAIELRKQADQAVPGLLVLPFGLSLQGGVTLQIDEQPALALQNFTTCLPAGCLVSLNFDEAAVSMLRGGTALKVTAATHDTKQDVALSISLKGLATALDRLDALEAS
ncbi:MULTISPECIES: invasion associated locus B family protein [Phyllobacteriaceae]|jgi:invasion protein IalB|uniref:Invasion protein n=3 Tax=Pseudomonadota TaxID=1224 RepID=A0A1C2DIA5_9HYPH|nr:MULTISPECIES: invasion associated locus B family protein [Mesorhizobium]MBN9234412.1 invasion associated locus B family protein [Mesorhizobium sp.]MDQ0332477.1 invasion protein IalB [Mesorhizobium sp. YL-MeA3-2017]OCX14502.1 hypothetical protein QV13_18740 [Mesorhizobium hungaricum]